MKRIKERFIENGKIWQNEQGELHNETGPAVVWPNGDMEWYIHGKRHRSNGPALTMAVGHEEWYQNGKLHRVDGPAIVSGPFDNNTFHRRWFLYGKEYDCVAWMIKVHELNNE